MESETSLDRVLREGLAKPTILKSISLRGPQKVKIIVIEETIVTSTEKLRLKFFMKEKQTSHPDMTRMWEERSY